jgi:hypothetical protein
MQHAAVIGVPVRSWAAFGAFVHIGDAHPVVTAPRAHVGERLAAPDSRGRNARRRPGMAKAGNQRYLAGIDRL